MTRHDAIEATLAAIHNTWAVYNARTPLFAGRSQ